MNDSPQSANHMEPHKAAFNRVGWFIPPYVTHGFLSSLAVRIDSQGEEFGQLDLQDILSQIYSAPHLAPMVTERYPVVPHIQEYKLIIGESIQAHFSGLHHIAAAGLIPVIEGAGKLIAAEKNIEVGAKKRWFIELVTQTKEELLANRVGIVGEIVSMLDSFLVFAKENLYANSEDYVLSDKTNRHGILHGRYADIDYGTPLNFYKAIGAVDFLCFIVSLRASISWLGPPTTGRSQALAQHYEVLRIMKRELP